MVRLAIAKAIDRDDLIERALFGRGAPGFGTINPAMRFFFDTAINETSEQVFDAAAAQQLLADAGFPGGEGFPTLKLLITPAGKREGEILADILKKNLNIEVELDIKDFPVLIDQFDAMEFDLVRIGSGGDYDPDDGLVDWMLTYIQVQWASTALSPWRSASSQKTKWMRLIEEQRTVVDLEQARANLVQSGQQN